MDPFRSLPVTLTANFIMLTQENSIEAPYAKDMHDKWFLSREECLSHSNKSKLLVVIVMKKTNNLSIAVLIWTSPVWGHDRKNLHFVSGARVNIEVKVKEIPFDQSWDKGQECKVLRIDVQYSKFGK